MRKFYPIALALVLTAGALRPETVSTPPATPPPTESSPATLEITPAELRELILAGIEAATPEIVQAVEAELQPQIDREAARADNAEARAAAAEGALTAARRDVLAWRIGAAVIGVLAALLGAWAGSHF